ncbi:MAG: lipoate--protein ligase [Bacteroidales bacterium]|nr:lipoate--protein ligase [Bacteroidales bacterium]
MRFIKSNTDDVYFNLAAEEYLLKHTVQDVCMIWQSAPSVVVGKHQNTYAEINLPYVLDNKINVARRISGGGTVFHGPGNINFTFIKNGEEGKLVDFKRYLTPIRDFLLSLHVDVEIGEANDLRIDGLKISGNAEHVYRKRVLHHGTLLLDSDLGILNKAIEVQAGKSKDKAVQSKRAVVTNILNHLNVPISDNEFCDELIAFLMDNDRGEYTPLNEEEIGAINRLREEHFTQTDWIFGYSPNHHFKNEIQYNDEKYTIELEVKRGIIEKADITSTGSQDMTKLVSMLIEQKHQHDVLKELLKETSWDELVMAFF